MFVPKPTPFFVAFPGAAVEVPPAGHRPRRAAPRQPLARRVATLAVTGLAGVQRVPAEPVAAAIAGAWRIAGAESIAHDLK